MKWKSVFQIFIICVLPLACAQKDGTTTGNPIRMTVQGTAPNSLSSSSVSEKASWLEKLSSKVSTQSATSIEVVDRSGTVVGSVTLTDARLALLNIEFEEDNDGTEDEFIEFGDIYLVDLLNDTTTPEIPLITVEDSGNYFEMVFDTIDIDSGDVDRDGNNFIEASDPLNNHSLYLEGTYTGPSASGAQTDIPFSMAVNISTEIEMTGPLDTSEGFNVTPGIINQLIVAFRLNKWFRFDNTDTNDLGLEPSQFVVSGGEIEIDSSTIGDNSDIADLIFFNILESADYGKDIDLDGELDIEEDDDPDEEDGDDE